MSVPKLFGDTSKLLRGSEEVDINVLAKSENQVVGIYFSAHWCPPCRAFTPKLAEWYKTFKENSPNKDDFEIVFVSSDRDVASFTEYYAEMPWLALPHAARDVKASLSTKFKVSGIPTLIFLEGKTGKVITKDGRSVVTDDPDGSEFPWRPKKLTDLLDGSLMNKDDMINWSDVKEEVIGIYFSAHWCGPCRQFTPQLSATYQKVQKNNKSFQIIFVSSDRDEESFKEYYGTMPWLAVPYEDKRKKTLSTNLGISGIPTLIIMKRSGEIITTKGRAEVSNDPEGADFPWFPKPVESLTSSTAGDINDNLSIIYFIKKEDNEKEIKDTLEAISKAHTDSEPDDKICFYYHKADDDQDDVGPSLKNFASVSDDHNLVIINVPAQEVYSTSGNGVDTLKETWKDFMDKKMKMKPLRS